MASSLLISGEKTLAGYLTSESRARAARHAAYSGGAVRAPKRRKPMSDAEKFGLCPVISVQPCGALWEGLRDGVVVCRDYTAAGAMSGARRMGAKVVA